MVCYQNELKIRRHFDITGVSSKGDTAEILSIVEMIILIQQLVKTLVDIIEIL